MSTEEFIAAKIVEGNIAMALFTKHSLLKESKGKHTSHNIYYYLNSENQKLDATHAFMFIEREAQPMASNEMVSLLVLAEPKNGCGRMLIICLRHEMMRRSCVRDLTFKKKKGQP